MSCCGQDDQKKPVEPGGAHESGGPMAMGMEMAKKMMSQMGQGGSPMEMMQKMMTEMGQGGGPPQMMQMCIGMCSEMLNAIRQTTAMAAFATPELQHAFAGWLEEIERKAEAAVADGEKDAGAIAASLGINEDSARYVLGRLAASGKVALVARPRG